MTTIVRICYVRCWDCQFQQCPGGPHTWMDSEDAEFRYGLPIPARHVLAAKHPCPCRCVVKPKTAYRWRQAQRDRRANPTSGQWMHMTYRHRNRT